MTGKTQRQRMIADWLRQHRVGSQEEVVARLSLAGIAATQATVSRDLLELGATGGDALVLGDVLTAPVAELREAWENGLARARG